MFTAELVIIWLISQIKRAPPFHAMLYCKAKILPVFQNVCFWLKREFMSAERISSTQWRGLDPSGLNNDVRFALTQLLFPRPPCFGHTKPPHVPGPYLVAFCTLMT